MEDKAIKKLESIIWDAITFQDTENFTINCKEILAAIRADITAYVPPKPLEFIERRNMTWEAVGWDYRIISNLDGTWRVKLGAKVMFARQKSFETAEQKTNAHLCKRVKELY